MNMFQKVPGEKGFNRIDASGMNLLNFHRIILAPGESFTGNTGEHETLFDILGGKARFVVQGKDYGVLGGRPNPFAGKGFSLYAPFNVSYTIEATRTRVVRSRYAARKATAREMRM